MGIVFIIFATLSCLVTVFNGYFVMTRGTSVGSYGGKYVFYYFYIKAENFIMTSHLARGYLKLTVFVIAGFFYEREELALSTVFSVWI